MFQNWGFLLAEIWLLLLIAALLGLFCGWLIWGGRRREADHGAFYVETKPTKVEPIGAPVPIVADDQAVDETAGVDEDNVQRELDLPQPDIGKPIGLDAPRSGVADDLKAIKGIGPKLEQMLHGMGVYHFDQIAEWGQAELAWVDSNLEGFYGRASRDEWVSQAQALAARQ